MCLLPYSIVSSTKETRCLNVHLDCLMLCFCHSILRRHVVSGGLSEVFVLKTGNFYRDVPLILWYNTRKVDGVLYRTSARYNRRVLKFVVNLKTHSSYLFWEDLYLSQLPFSVNHITYCWYIGIVATTLLSSFMANYIHEQKPRKIHFFYKLN